MVSLVRTHSYVNLIESRFRSSTPLSFLSSAYITPTLVSDFIVPRVFDDYISPVTTTITTTITKTETTTVDSVDSLPLLRSPSYGVLRLVDPFGAYYPLNSTRFILLDD